MSRVKIYHNPRCSKSRQTLALLEDRDLDVEVVEYLKDPPSVRELDALCTRLGKEPQEIVRKGDLAKLGISTEEFSRDDWLKTMTENPILIERPIVVRDKAAALGRPPEAVLEIL